MKDNLHDIDKLFKAALDAHEETPPADVWDAIDKKLDKNKVIDINRKYIQLKRIAIVLLVLLLGAGVYTLTTFKTTGEHANDNLKNNEQRSSHNSNLAQSKIKQDKTIGSSTLPADENNVIKETDKGTAAITQTQTKKDKSGTTEIIKEIKNQDTQIEKKSVNTASENKNDLKQSGNNTDYAAFNKTAQKTTNEILNKKDSRKIVTYKRSQKTTITGAAYAEVENENVKPVLQNKEVVTTGRLKNIPVINPEIIRPITSFNSLVISANNNLSINNLKQSIPGKMKNKNVASSFAATVFFAPNISSNKIKEEKHEQRPGRPDNDDRERIRQGEQHQSSTTFGVLLDYNINQHWSLQSGASLTNKTIHINPKTIYADKDDNGAVKYLYDCSSGYAFLSSKSVANPVVGDSLQAFESTNKLQYLSIPLAVKYMWALKKIDLFASVGTAVNILTKGQLETEIEDGFNKQATISNKINGLKPAYLGGNISIGAAYNFNAKFAFSFTPVFNFALASSTKGAAVKTYPNSIGLAAGIRYKL